MGPAAIEALLAEGDGLARPMEPAATAAVDDDRDAPPPRLRIVGGE
jgi:hypothetical protein